MPLAQSYSSAHTSATCPCQTCWLLIHRNAVCHQSTFSGQCVWLDAAQGANLSFKSQRNGYDNLKSAEPMKSFKHSPSKLGSSPARPSNDGGSVMSKMKRSVTMLGGRAGSEAGMTDRSAKVQLTLSCFCCRPSLLLPVAFQLCSAIKFCCSATLSALVSHFACITRRLADQLR